MYCISIWDSTWLSFLERILKAQKVILRVMSYKRKFDSSEKVFFIVTYVHQYFMLLCLFNSLKNNCNIFMIQEHCRNTERNQINLICPQFQTTFFRNSICILGPQVWNSLPNSFKDFSISTTFFKYKLKKFLFSVTINVITLINFKNMEHYRNHFQNNSR